MVIVLFCVCDHPWELIAKGLLFFFGRLDRVFCQRSYLFQNKRNVWDTLWDSVGWLTACCMTFGLRDTTERHGTTRRGTHVTTQVNTTQHCTSQQNTAQPHGTSQYNTTRHNIFTVCRRNDSPIRKDLNRANCEVVEFVKRKCRVPPGSWQDTLWWVSMELEGIIPLSDKGYRCLLDLRRIL
jgi:hypothetical protein